LHRWVARGALGLVVLGSTGCLATAIALRGAPSNEIEELSFVLPAVALPDDSTGHIQTAPHFERIPFEGWLHGFEIQLLDGQGAELPPELLHHLEVMIPGKRELLSPLMLRLVGAGSETRRASLPAGLGVSVEAGDSVLIVASLHNPTGKRYADVRLGLTLRATKRGPWRPPLDVVPFFTQVEPPLESAAFDLPSGVSERTLDLTFPIPGRILGLGGHLHRYGESLALRDADTGETLWEGVARRDDDGTVLQVPQDQFVWSGGIEVSPDRRYRFVVRYHNPGQPISDGAMGTLAGVFLPDAPWPSVDRADPVYLTDWERNASGNSHGAHMHGPGRGGPAPR
jgi:hypothetical protein